MQKERPKMGRPEGKVAIVTGASRGIGAGVAFVLAKAGATVALVGRDNQRASRLIDEIVANSGQAVALACDVADYRSVRTMIDDTERQLGSIDIVIIWRPQIHVSTVIMPQGISLAVTVEIGHSIAPPPLSQDRLLPKRQ
jgi:saccharopine dehydrogenase-like NADP-dependent oxidoreductase